MTRAAAIIPIISHPPVNRGIMTIPRPIRRRSIPIPLFHPTATAILPIRQTRGTRIPTPTTPAMIRNPVASIQNLASILTIIPTSLRTGLRITILPRTPTIRIPIIRRINTRTTHPAHAPATATDLTRIRITRPTIRAIHRDLSGIRIPPASRPMIIRMPIRADYREVIIRIPIRIRRPVIPAGASSITMGIHRHPVGMILFITLDTRITGSLPLPMGCPTIPASLPSCLLICGTTRMRMRMKGCRLICRLHG